MLFRKPSTGGSECIAICRLRRQSDRRASSPERCAGGVRLGIANRVVGRGEACAQAIALAQEIARFPQTWMRADRLSALRQWDMSEEEAISNEMRGGLEVIGSGETFAGASRFASGIGR